ncbi:MAG: TIGR02757 family protein [Treponema sp.]|nr:TIGR02757 family protein [Treponema sp.]
MKTKTDSNKTKIPEKLKTSLKILADKYENLSFMKNDPSSFMHRYTNPRDQEAAAFISANLSFGRREQILRKISYILDAAEPHLSDWIVSEEFTKIFPDSQKKFYRFFSYGDMRLFFLRYKDVLEKFGSLGNAVEISYKNLATTACGTENKGFCRQQLILSIITTLFKDSRLIPQDQSSACKKLNMFLRWMVRTNSPVDLGLWTWYNAEDLLIPLDTHVISSARKMKLLPKDCAVNFKTALLLTQKMKQIWPDDPCKADFALFGYGINNNNIFIKN